MIFELTAGAAAAGGLLGSLYAYRVAYHSPKKGREDEYLLPTEEQYASSLEIMRGCIDLLRKVPYEPVQIHSEDGKLLFGRYYHRNHHAPVQIQFHGYRGSAMRDFCGGAQLALKMGHNVLLVDQRAHGKSEGGTITFGVRERLDCLRWCRYARRRFGPKRPLILAGVSMGAATVLMASELPLPNTVQAILADCPYSDQKRIIGKVAKERGMPAIPSVVACTAGAMIYGRFRLGQTSPLEAVKRTKIPILLLHGEDDRFVPCDMSRELFAACASPKRLETFPGAAHGTSYLSDPDRYERVVREFLQEHVKE